MSPKKSFKTVLATTFATILIISSSLNVTGTPIYSLESHSFTTIGVPPIHLQTGTSGNSTIYENNTSAKVTVSAPTNWWNSSWFYRKPILVTEQSGNDLTNYAVDFTINTQELIAENKMNEDCSDIRFIGSSNVFELPITLNNSANPNELLDFQTKIQLTNQSILDHISSDGRDIRLFASEQTDPYSIQNEIPFWIQSRTTDEMIIWTKTNLNASSMMTLYLYYGNHDASPVSNGTEVFDFFDDFSADTLEDYDIVDLGIVTAPSSWAITDGRMQETSNIYTHGAPDMNGTFAYYTGEEWDNNILEARISSTDDDLIGLIFRYTNNSNYYRFAWGKQDHTSSGSLDPGRYLHEISDGIWSLLDSDNAIYTEGQSYDVSIRINGNYFEIYVDDSLVLNGTGTDTEAGKVGMYSWACQNTYWDDIRIRKYASMEPMVSVGDEIQFDYEDIELPYWIESGQNSTNTRIWVNIPFIPTNGNTSIYLYYGNSNASIVADAKSTFYRYLNFTSGADGIDGGVSGQDGVGFPSNFEVLDNGRTLHIWGNIWKYTNLPTINNGDGSQILEFNMSSFDNGEIQGIGISNTISGPDSSHTYRFAGSQSWGLTPDKKYSGSSGDWQSVYVILNDFSGSFSYFIWAGDDDADGSQNCSFKDVKIRPYSAPEPTTSIGEEETIYYNYVLKIVNQQANDWILNMRVDSTSNINRISKMLIKLQDGKSSDQIIVSDGNVTQSEGPPYDDLDGNEILYLILPTVLANNDGTTLISCFLTFWEPSSTIRMKYVVTFEVK